MFLVKKGTIVLELGDQEADLMRHTINDYVELLDSRTPLDPVNRRLFPAASGEDEDVAREFRALTFSDLDAHKRSTAALAIQSLGAHRGCRVKLNPEQNEAWLVLLTDIRLAIGTRLGVTEEMLEREVDPNEDWNLALLHYLGALQEALVNASEAIARW
ncbi:MAG: DUF2017 family protein [Actinomycetota bacterium]